MSSRSRSKSRSRSRSRSPIRVDSVALRSCNGLPSSDCRERAFCRWVAANEHKNKLGVMTKFKGHCKKARQSKSPKRAKSPRRSRSPKKAKSPSRCRAILRKSPCRKAVGCAWVKKHAGRNGKKIPSMCRGVRVSKKSPKRVSACHSKLASECKESRSCTWAKGYDRKDGKHVAGACRRRKGLSNKKPGSKKVSGAASARGRSASPRFLRTVRSM